VPYDGRHLLVTALENSGFSMTGVYVGPLDCSDSTLLLGRRIQDNVSFGLEFDAMCPDTSSANSFSSEVTDAAESFQSEFVSEAASTLSMNVTATLGDVTVTSADDTNSSSGIRGCGVFACGEHDGGCVLSRFFNSRL